MTDDQEPSNDVGDDSKPVIYDTNYENDLVDSNDITTTTIIPPAPVINDGENSVIGDYPDDEPLEDFTVNLYVNVDPNGPIIPPDLVNAGITDRYGNVIPQATTWRDSVDNYTTSITQEIYDGLSTNATDVSGKGLFGPWSWNKALVVAFIGLCIIGIILALLFIIIGKKFNKNKRTPPSTAAPTTTATGTEGSKGLSPKSKYSPVPTSV